MRLMNLFAGFLIVLSLNACAHQVGGKSIDDVFSGETRQLAGFACRGDTKGIQRLVDEGADVNALGLDGASVLMWALSCQNLSGVKALMDNGADPNHKVKNNLNPVTIAASIQQNPELLKAVITAGGSVNAVSGSHEETALMTAFSRGIDTGNWDNYYYLLEAGANINQLTNKGRSIGFHARRYNQNCKIIELIDMGLTEQLDMLLVLAKGSPALIKGSEGERCLAPLIVKLETRIAELDSAAP